MSAEARAALPLPNGSRHHFSSLAIVERLVGRVSSRQCESASALAMRCLGGRASSRNASSANGAISPRAAAQKTVVGAGHVRDDLAEGADRVDRLESRTWHRGIAAVALVRLPFGAIPSVANRVADRVLGRAATDGSISHSSATRSGGSCCGSFVEVRIFRIRTPTDGSRRTR